MAFVSAPSPIECSWKEVMLKAGQGVCYKALTKASKGPLPFAAIA